VISFQIKQRGGYAGSASEIRHAVHLIGKASGLRFTEVRSAAANPDITIEWESPRSEPDLAGAVAARTETLSVSDGGVEEIIGANIYLDRTTAIRHGFPTSGLPAWGQVYLHELGHAVGLAHVGGRDEIMNPAVSRYNHVLATGDLRRLRRVGAPAGCITASSR
jgi:predicted Zn-dependent protease